MTLSWRTVRAQFWQGTVPAARVLIDRAVERHELPADANAELALEQLVAPLHFRTGKLLTHLRRQHIQQCGIIE